MTRHITLSVLFTIWTLVLLQQVQALPRDWAVHHTGLRRSLGLYSRATTIPNGWAYTDCVTDSGSPRGLQGYSFDSSAMTVNLCITTCHSKGFVSPCPVRVSCRADSSVSVSTSLGSNTDDNVIVAMLWVRSHGGVNAIRGSLLTPCVSSRRVRSLYDRLYDALRRCERRTVWKWLQV